MNLDDLINSNRRKELIAICAWIRKANFEELAHIVEEIRCYHDNLCVWNPNTKQLDNVDSISINGESIQLNIKEE